MTVILGNKYLTIKKITTGHLGNLGIIKIIKRANFWVYRV